MTTTKIIIAASLIIAVEVTVMAIFISLWVIPLALGCVLMVVVSSLEWKLR